MTLWDTAQPHRSHVKRSKKEGELVVQNRLRRWQRNCLIRHVLHKTSKVSGFHIHSTTGAIGHVDDFLVDEQWAIAYLVVDTSNWLGGKSVLISTAMVTKIDSPARRIYVNLTREQIANGPSIDTAEIELIETLPPFLIF